MYKVSVIVPVYNTENYLDACIQSALNQTLKDIEVICINDCSTDHSEWILRKYESADSRLKVHSLEKNRGQAYARNRGIECAKGEYIYFLDSDDMLKSDALERLYHEAVSNDLEGILFDGDTIYEDESLCKQMAGNSYIRCNTYSGVHRGKTLCEEMIVNEEFLVMPCLQFWNREYLNQMGARFVEGIIHEDFLFTFLAVWNCERIKYISERLFIRRYRSGSTMTKLNWRRSFIGYFTALYYIRKMLNGHVSEIMERYITRWYVRLVLNKNHQSTREEIWKEIVEGTGRTTIFVNDEVRDAFLNFEACTKLHIPNGDFSRLFKETVYKYGKIYIYGAGEIARGVLEGFAKDDILIEGFLVSSREGNPKTFMGHPVMTLKDAKMNAKDSFIVIALDEMYYEDVAKRIEEVLPGIGYMLYKR